MNLFLLTSFLICITTFQDCELEARIGWGGRGIKYILVINSAIQILIQISSIFILIEFNHYLGIGSWKSTFRPMEPDFWASKYDRNDYDWDEADERMMEKYRNSKLGMNLIYVRIYMYIYIDFNIVFVKMVIKYL